MFPVMKVASKLNGYIFCLLSAAMLFYSVPKVLTFAEKEMDAVSLYFNGQLSREFEKSYDEKLFLRELSIEYWADLRYWLFNEGLDGVVIGDEGWLYSKEEFSFPNNTQAVVEQHFNKVLEVKQAMAEVGKKLIILPVPMKLDIYSEHTPYDVKQSSEALYKQFVTLLDNHNISNSPIRNAFLDKNEDQLLFLKKDTHWTPAGAELAASSLATRFPELVGETEYVSHTESNNEVVGDLVNFIKVSRWVNSSIYDAEIIPLYETTKSETEDGDSALFGEQSISLALVGTSYTAIDDWNFAGFLKQHLKNNLVSVSVKEKGPFVAMEQFLQNDIINDSDVDTVIWEFPVRALIASNQTGNAWQSAMDDIF